VAEGRSSRLEEAERLGYEPVDANIRAVLAVALGWSIFVGLAAGLLIGLVDLFQALRPPPETPPLARIEIQPPEPRLEANPKIVLERVRQREDQLLNGLAWVNRNAGVARIPIDRAMAILVRQGWPKPSEPSSNTGDAKSGGTKTGEVKPGESKTGGAGESKTGGAGESKAGEAGR
jgi:hypothetical protein